MPREADRLSEVDLGDLVVTRLLPFAAFRQKAVELEGQVRFALRKGEGLLVGARTVGIHYGRG